MTMTGRYIRRATRLEVRGLSQVPLHDPFAALEQTTSNLPQEFLGPVNEALTSYHGTPSSSGRSSPTITETQSTMSLAQPGWTTGNTTERSSTDSTYSWDEFDKQAAKTVQFFFDQIDSVLYEQNVDGPLYIQKECQEWSLQFPHLRILGRQLISPQDQGFQLIEREGSRPSTGSLGLMDVTDVDIAATQDIQGLSLSGRHVRARKPPVEARSNRQGSDASVHREFTHLEEEVFEQEGDYEEIIAIEYRDIYDESSEKKQLTPRRRRVGYPPITPNASIKDSVISSAFDSLWQEIVSWKKPLVRKYSNIVLEESKPLIIPINQDVTNLSSHNARNDPLPPSREPSFQFLNSKLQRSNTTVGVPRLDDVLQISRKNLQIRENSSLHDSDPIINTARPGSSVTNHKSRPVSVKLPQRIPPPQRGPMIRLAPISLTDRSKTPNVDEDRPGPTGALKVTRLTPQNESLTSPPSHQRNGALPPLSAEIDVSVPSQIRLQKKVHSANRASSAVDKDIRGLHRERYTLQSDVRPSTTHAMRSDTPLGATSSRRASTPFGGVNTFPQRSTALGITGSGLQPSTDLGHLGNYPPDILEDAEANIDDVYHNQWTPSPPSHHNPYRRLKQVSSLVRS